MFEILLRVSEGNPWKETLLQVLPQRKFQSGGKRKHTDSNSQADKVEKILSEDKNPIENELRLEEKTNENSVPLT